MNIIFGDSVKLLPPGAVVLELDTICLENQRRIKTYCAVEKLPEHEYIMLESNKTIHATLLDQYRQQNWTGCKRLIEALHGQWGGELDSFYDVLLERIGQYEQIELPKDWDGSYSPTK